MRKSARVYSNDIKKGIQRVTLKAYVKVPIRLSTHYLYFAGLSDSEIAKTVTIEAKEEKPLELEALSFDLGDKVNYKIEEINPGREFQVQFNTIPGIFGTYLGALKLKTNYSKKPELIIRIRGRIKKARPAAEPQKTNNS
jgi:hypothetical protein